MTEDQDRAVEPPHDDAQDHYFTARPASAAERRTISVRLAGRDVEVEVASGVFSPGRLDLGTQVLLRTAPALDDVLATRAGGGPAHVLDLGCGWGPIALTMALEAPGATVWAVDVNERALDLVRRTSLTEGRSVQTLHVGPYDAEGPVLAELHDVYLPEHGLTFAGPHHEIYLSDVRRTDPARLRTVLRQPVRPL